MATQLLLGDHQVAKDYVDGCLVDASGSAETRNSTEHEPALQSNVVCRSRIWQSDSSLDQAPRYQAFSMERCAIVSRVGHQRE